MLWSHLSKFEFFTVNNTLRSADDESSVLDCTRFKTHAGDSWVLFFYILELISLYE